MTILKWITEAPRLVALVLLALVNQVADAQTGITSKWTWMAGSSMVGSNDGRSGVYGVLGVPASGNSPGGREDTASWTDSGGHLWLFGGQGFDADGNYGYLNVCVLISPLDLLKEHP